MASLASLASSLFALARAVVAGVGCCLPNPNHFDGDHEEVLAVSAEVLALLAVAAAAGNVLFIMI